jgi:[ribosomal protein S5]-alanine N-acetyltransferase
MNDSPDLFAALATSRLSLEVIAESHATHMYNILMDDELYRFMPSEHPANIEALRARYSLLSSGLSPRAYERWLNWIVVPHEAVPIGYVQATLDLNQAFAVMGWLIGSAFQRRGFALESVSAVCQHLMLRGVTRFQAVVDERNVASIALAERLGFQRTRTVHSADVIKGVRGYDHIYVREIAHHS